MTKKHFRALAAKFHSIKEAQNAAGTFPMPARTTWEASINAIADVCGEVNERFDRAKFILACEEGL